MLSYLVLIIMLYAVVSSVALNAMSCFLYCVAPMFCDVIRGMFCVELCNALWYVLRCVAYVVWILEWWC